MFRLITRAEQLAIDTNKGRTCHLCGNMESLVGPVDFGNELCEDCYENCEHLDLEDGQCQGCLKSLHDLVDFEAMYEGDR